MFRDESLEIPFLFQGPIRFQPQAWSVHFIDFILRNLLFIEKSIRFDIKTLGYEKQGQKSTNEQYACNHI